jgi:hypothetical protein
MLPGSTGGTGGIVVPYNFRSREGLHQHDADLSTFHRIAGFRELALDLMPQW